VTAIREASAPKLVPVRETVSCPTGSQSAVPSPSTRAHPLTVEITGAEKENRPVPPVLPCAHT